jgi:hypothetical protein
VHTIRAGSTIFLPGTPHGHLWFVLTDSDAEGFVVITMLVSHKGHHFPSSLVLTPEDHPWITRESVVDLGASTFKGVKKLNGLLNRGKGCKLEASMSSALLKKVRDALIVSGDVSNDVKAHCIKLFRPST